MAGIEQCNVNKQTIRSQLEHIIQGLAMAGIEQCNVNKQTIHSQYMRFTSY